MTVVLPTSWFPPVSYFIYLIQQPESIIELHETFPKQTIRNRCYIATAQGKFHLSVPLEKHSAKTISAQIRPSYNENWQTKHWRAISTAYGSSPFFIYYEDRIRKLLEARHEFLFELNDAILKGCYSILKEAPRWTYSSEFIKEESILDKRQWKEEIIQPYSQVFSERTRFLNDVSILDLIFNLGPEAKPYLKRR